MGRRFPRFHLDVDWFVESRACSTLGRGIQLSARGALLPVACTSPFTEDVTLYVALPGRPRMFKALCAATATPRGWVLEFVRVSSSELQLLSEALLSEGASSALRRLELHGALSVPLH